MGAPSRPLIVNDEVDMLRYRRQLHEPITRQVVIVEANLTFTGIPKPLHVRDTLSQAELERHNVLLLQALLSAQFRSAASLPVGEAFAEI